jgi:hypothetical protein
MRFNHTKNFNPIVLLPFLFFILITTCEPVGDYLNEDDFSGKTGAKTPVIDLEPADIVYVQGDTSNPLTVEASVSGGGSLSYQWYSNTSNSNSGGTHLGTGRGATTANYFPSTRDAGTQYYYAVVINTNTAVDGNQTAAKKTRAAKVIVSPNPDAIIIDAQAPVITVEPADEVYTQGVTPKVLQITASVQQAGGTLSYQWYSNSENSNTGGVPLGSDYGAATYRYTPSTAFEGVLYYYVVMTNTNNTVTGETIATTSSRAVKVEIKPADGRPEGLYNENSNPNTKIILDGETGDNIVEKAVAYINKLGNSGQYTLILGNGVFIGVDPQTLNQDQAKLTITTGAGVDGRDLQLISNGPMFTIGGTNTGAAMRDTTLVIEGNITLKGRAALAHGGHTEDNNNSLLRVQYGGKLILKGHAVVTENYYVGASSHGTGIYLQSFGTLTLSENASIKGFWLGGGGARGAGVFIFTNATFFMNGGDISENTMPSGYHNTVHIASGGTFNFSGGSIHDNEELGDKTGGAVGVASGGKFIMSGSAVIPAGEGTKRNSVYLENINSPLIIDGILDGSGQAALIDLPDTYRASFPVASPLIKKYNPAGDPFTYNTPYATEHAPIDRFTLGAFLSGSNMFSISTYYVWNEEEGKGCLMTK